jgi:hypothetical protein
MKRLATRRMTGSNAVMLDPDRLSTLLDSAAPAVSIYLPIDPEQRDIRAPEVRLRRRIEEADTQLAQAGVENGRRSALLAPARAAQATDFARHRDPGLALFLAEGWSEILSLPAAPAEMLVIGPHFHIKPLLPMLERNRRFHILALSAGNARLLSATAYDWSEIELTALPDEVQAELDSTAAVRAGEDTAKSKREQRRALMLQDPHRVAYAVRAALGTDRAPIILAAEPQVAGRFRKVAQLPQLRPETIALNPFALTDAELHARAMAVIGPAIEEEANALIEQVNARLGAGEHTVTIRLDEILAAGQEGRIDAVAVALDEALWGRYEPGRPLSPHGQPAPGEEDLLNLAAIEALRTGARAYALPRARLPRQAPAVATLRF